MTTSSVIISLFIQQNSTNTVTNVGTNEVETGMTRLIALTVTPVYKKNIGSMTQVKKDNGTDRYME